MPRFEAIEGFLCASSILIYQFHDIDTPQWHNGELYAITIVEVDYRSL